MRLTLVDVEKKLIEHGITSQTEIDNSKKSRNYGGKTCKILRKFRSEAKRDYSLFLPRKPNMKTFHQRSKDLFKKGESKIDEENPAAGLDCLEEEGLASDEELPMSAKECAVQTSPG